MTPGGQRRRKSTAPARRSGARSQPTRERILDAAERLFAQRGFHGVSIRDITGEAGVDVALANYHFGSKHGLLEAVFARRAEELNTERLARLDAVLATGRRKAPTLEEIIDAFTHPLLDRSARGGPGWKSYFALVAEVNNSPEFGGVEDPLARRARARAAAPGWRCSSSPSRAGCLHGTVLFALRQDIRRTVAGSRPAVRRFWPTAPDRATSVEIHQTFN